MTTFYMRGCNALSNLTSVLVTSDNLADYALDEFRLSNDLLSI